MSTRPNELQPVLATATLGYLVVAMLADLSPLAKLAPGSPLTAALGALAASVHAPALAVFAIPMLVAWLVATDRVPSLPPRVLALLNVAMVAALFVAIAVALPRFEALHAIGRGSDQAACITSPATELAHGRWPYVRALIWTGNACSDGFGWIALATPFVVLARSYPAFLVAGALVLAASGARVYEARVVTATLALVLSCLAAWQAMVTGSDVLAIGFAVALVTALADWPSLTVPVAIAAGLVATSRLPFLFVPVLLGASISRAGDTKRGIRFLAIGLGTAILAHVVALAWNGVSYRADGPFHVFGKARDYADATSPAVFLACGVAWLSCAALLLKRARTPDPATLQLGMAMLLLLSVLAPAYADLVGQMMASDESMTASALSLWRGANWLMVSLPCFAAAVALAARRGQRSSA